MNHASQPTIARPESQWVAGGLRGRVAAFALDYILVAAWIAVVVGIGVVVRQAVPDLAAAIFGNPLSAQLAGFMTLTFPIAAYFVLSEAAPSGATWGKRRMALRVLTADNRQLGIGQSVLRTAVKFLPWELAHAVIWRYAIPGSAPGVLLDAGLVAVWALVGINVLVAATDPRRRTLYDRISATVVVRA